MFEPIKVTYNGEEKTIPSDNFLIVLAEVEDCITFDELNDLLAKLRNGKRVTFGKLTMAFYVLLLAAGFKSDKAELLKKVASSEELENAITSLVNLFKHLMDTEEDTEKKPEPPKKKKTKS